MKVELFDADGHAVGIKAHRHVEFKIGCDGDTLCRSRDESQNAGCRVHRPAGCLFHANQIRHDRSLHRFFDRTRLTTSAGRVGFDKLETLVRSIASADDLARGAVIRPVLESKSIGAAFSRPKEGDQGIQLRLVLEA